MIHINQIGYLPNETKVAILTEPSDVFELIYSDNHQVVFQGTPVAFSEAATDAASGDSVWLADFSELTTSGSYCIRTANEVSASFAIGEQIYKSLKNDLIKSYYYQRCGCALLPQHAGRFSHGCCHTALATLVGESHATLELSGGWHDAGDYGRYTTAAATALAHLLYAFELFPERFQEALNIPESGNGVPDLLNECRYELEWLLKMQLPDGSVFHKVSTWRHAAFVMPEEDTAPLYAYAVSSMAVGDFAAVCALAARIYAAYDTDFSMRLTAAAIQAYRFLQAHPDFIPFRNPEGSGTGEYGDRSDRDERFWAAAELFRLTGEQCYWEDFVQLYAEDFSKTHLGYASTGGFGTLSLLTHPNFRFVSDCSLSTHMTTEQQNIAAALFRSWCDEADNYVTFARESGYQVAMTSKDFHWGSNMTVMNRGITLIVAYLLTKNPCYRTAACNQLHYLLGRNATGYSYVTGHGTKYIRHPHMRTIFADGIDEPIPGFVSGGPNARPCDPAAPLIPADTPPMKSFADVYEAYSLNEVTIYWNSPAVFVAAFFDSAEA
ncbi:MAG: glycoside hydrolase family 9 protein [Lachnospiraceae bacterium]|nr:glycoside hydrolase family 9 protein [Lachnospiraceae bacterium]